MMPSVYLFLVGTLLLSLNFIRVSGLAISDWFYFGALGLAIIETARFDRKNFTCWTRNRFLWPAGLILLGAIISTARAVFVGTAIVEIIQELFVITLFISLIWVMVNRGKTETIMRAFIWSGVFTAGVAIADFILGTRIGPALSRTPDVLIWGRYAGTLGHPNKLGYYLVLTSLLSLSELLRAQTGRSLRLSKLFWVLMIAIQLLGLYLSGSLNAYLGLMLGWMALLLSSPIFLRRTVRFLIPLLYVAAIVAIMGIIFGSAAVSDTSMGLPMVSTAIGRVGTITAQARWEIYTQAVDLIVKNPMVGVGYDQVSTSGIGSDFRALSGTVHNLLLQSWYVGGLFTFVGWLVIYIILVWEAISTLYGGEKRYTLPAHLCAAAAVLSISLMDQFQDAIYQREKWLVIGLFITVIWSRKWQGGRV